jgi:hypothetical protein
MAIQDWREPGCRTVCRPWRSKARTFGPRDVGRVVKAALNNGEDKAVIVAHVMLALGYDTLICNTAAAVNDLTQLTTFLGRVKGLMAILTSLSALIEWLKGGPLSRLPYTRAIIILAIAISALMDGILGVLGRWQLFTLKLQLIQQTISAWCGWIRIIRVEQGGRFDHEDDIPSDDYRLPEDVPYPYLTDKEFRNDL